MIPQASLRIAYITIGVGAGTGMASAYHMHLEGVATGLIQIAAGYGMLNRNATGRVYGSPGALGLSEWLFRAVMIFTGFAAGAALLIEIAYKHTHGNTIILTVVGTATWAVLATQLVNLFFDWRDHRRSTPSPDSAAAIQQPTDGSNQK